MINSDDLNNIMTETFNKCSNLLNKKSEEYNKKINNRLDCFTQGAGLTGEHPAKIVTEFMLKHVISIYQMINSIYEYDMSKWDEKIIDNINYLILLRAALIDSYSKLINVDKCENNNNDKVDI